eukprot:Seg4739.1 transcript_id=Seg4739.1/GoldUCD/mRNA.D3Y31 product="UPF0669 protein v1g209471" protein_id=Seg4739.1/GoldUCD/D3Y31
MPLYMATGAEVILFLLVLSGRTIQFTDAETIISTFVGKLGPGNYSYFKLHEKGTITFVLESLVGDADIYVSKTADRPSFADYDLQAITCGTDIVTVPKAFPRPVNVAVFGHVHSLITKYKLTAILDYEGKYDPSVSQSFSYDQESDWQSEDDDSQSLKSLLWTIIVGILKIILEVIF